jgi:hypothetical protein
VLLDEKEKKKKKDEVTPAQETPMSPPGVLSPKEDSDDNGLGSLGKSLMKSNDEEPNDDDEPKWKKTAKKLVNAATKVGSYMANI